MAKGVSRRGNTRTRSLHYSGLNCILVIIGLFVDVAERDGGGNVNVVYVITTELFVTILLLLLLLHPNNNNKSLFYY